jgi:hypothetical protein
MLQSLLNFLSSIAFFVCSAFGINMTMGFGAVSGLPMATRSGDVSLGALFYLLRLLRILPSPGVAIDRRKRPVVVVDPRAGQAPGIGAE